MSYLPIRNTNTTGNHADATQMHSHSHLTDMTYGFLKVKNLINGYKAGIMKIHDIKTYNSI